VTAIGWGSQNGRNYWIIKNSWGTGWGEGGFGKMQRGINIRSFNQNIFYPIIN
jgi:cathepsin L